METQVKKLSRISKIECLNPGNYYSITIYKGEINLQGHYDRKLVIQLRKLFGEIIIDGESGCVECARNGIEVTLT